MRKEAASKIAERIEALRVAQGGAVAAGKAKEGGPSGSLPEISALRRIYAVEVRYRLPARPVGGVQVIGGGGALTSNGAASGPMMFTTGDAGGELKKSPTHENDLRLTPPPYATTQATAGWVVITMARGAAGRA